jgi:hypothetical protein
MVMSDHSEDQAYKDSGDEAHTDRINKELWEEQKQAARLCADCEENYAQRSSLLCEECENNMTLPDNDLGY